jgi:hypothetical protein
MKTLSIVFAVFFVTGMAAATIINVPGGYPTIQAGIDAASAGDTVLVAPGIYVENVQLTGGATAENLTLMGSGMENTIVDGGGLFNVIYVYQVSNVTIEGFTVQNSHQGGGAPGNVGIHLNPISSSGTKIVKNCHVKNCGNGIDIWNDFGGVAYIEHNIISDNIYDGFDPYLGTTYLTNNTIVNNGSDGYSDWSGGGVVYIKNNIIANNGRYGIYKHQTTPVFISYNDVWNNAEGAYYEGYSGPAIPFVPNPGTGEIAADPLFFGNPFDYYITWANYPVPDPTKSPCIDAGDPTLPVDPDGTVPDMGAFYFHQEWHDVEITLTPFNPPILIPASGGSFDFNVLITNNEAVPVGLDAWIMVTLPSGTLYGPVLGPVDLTMSGSGSIDRDRTQSVPAGAPPGTYTYSAHVGIFPTTIWNGGGFDFEKLIDGDGIPVSQWLNTGSSFEGEMALQVPTTPVGFVLLSAYPNPFNPTTTISYSLPEASRIDLTIFDLNGRRIATLVDGWRDAGYHEATFDGSHLASGMYVFTLVAGNFAESGKMVLVK